MKHVICIRSAYTEGLLSERRLQLTEEFCIESLRKQDHSYELIVKVDANDPHLRMRQQMFQSLKVPIRFTDGEWHTEGWAYKTRMDDDDALFPTFMSRLAASVGSSEWYTFAEGWVLNPNDKLLKRRYVENQFVTRFCGPTDSPYCMNHTKVTGHKIIDEDPAWIWVRHEDAKSPIQKWPRGCYGELPFGYTQYATDQVSMSYTRS